MNSQPVEPTKPVIDPEKMFAVAEELEDPKSEPAVPTFLSPDELMKNPTTRQILLGMT